MDYFSYSFEILAVSLWSQVPQLDCASASSILRQGNFSLEHSNDHESFDKDHGCLRTGQEVMEHNEWNPDRVFIDCLALGFLILAMHLISFSLLKFRLKWYCKWTKVKNCCLPQFQKCPIDRTSSSVATLLLFLTVYPFFNGTISLRLFFHLCSIVFIRMDHFFLYYHDFSYPAIWN